MAQDPNILILISIGLVSGIVSGIFGIGGGIIIIPALVYLIGFPQHIAIGTSLAILLPPVGLGAVIEYYRHGNVDFHTAIIVAIGLFIGAWIGSYFAGKASDTILRLSFGVFIVCLGLYIIMSTLKKLPVL